ncbi:MAG TPA: alpha/beta hydrolase [Streptosporangiaceae bacterium]|nr:alpha/beta hydrolase [Streptosporangiaceae bacterium]
MSTPRSLEMPDHVRSATLQTARGTFAVLEAQPCRGVSYRRPAILVPGFTGSKEDFLAILEPLASAGRHVYAIDQRGQFQSPHAADRAGYSAPQLAADVLAIADAVAPDADGMHLVGHSMGGLIAREAVLTRAASFLSLTLLGSGPGALGGQRAATLTELLSVLDQGDGDSTEDRVRLAGLVRLIWRDQLEPQARADGTDDHIIAFLRERTLRTCPIHYIAIARYLLTCADRTDELADAAAIANLSTMVVYGENDDAWPTEEQDQMAKRLGAERACIPGAAHSPAVEAPVTTSSILTQFWNAAERRQPTIHSCGRSRRAAS